MKRCNDSRCIDGKVPVNQGEGLAACLDCNRLYLEEQVEQLRARVKELEAENATVSFWKKTAEKELELATFHGKKHIEYKAKVEELEAETDYAYKTISEYELIVGHFVNDSFRIGWNMARTLNRHIDALNSKREGEDE